MLAVVRLTHTALVRSNEYDTCLAMEINLPDLAQSATIEAFSNSLGSFREIVESTIWTDGQ